MRKTAIVTGANRGLGKAIVEKMAEQQYDIWACARKKNLQFEEYLGRLSQKYDVGIKAVYMNLAEEEEIKRAYQEICADKRPINVLINNAGIGHMDLFQMTKMSYIRDVYEVNLFAPMLLTQLVMRNMSRQHDGKIINVASTAAKEIYEGNAVYGATKAALIAFTQSLAAEAYRYGITVNAIAPGLLDTQMSVIFEGKDPQKAINHTALGRKILPEEVADIIVELLSDKMKIVNGEVVYINGGHK